MISDLAGGDKRVIFKPKVTQRLAFFASRDLSMVALLLTRPDGARINAMIKTDGTGYREIGGRFRCRPEWSWDNRYLLVCETQPDGTRQLLRVSVADGETRKLRETDGVGHAFSPDGRFIAIVTEVAISGKIFVVPSQGGEPQLVSDNARLLDWTRDGRYLAIVVDRSGAEALYLLPIKDGRQAGDPVFVRYGSFMLGRTTVGGALSYISTPPGGGYAAWLGALDTDGRLSGWKRLRLSGSSEFGVKPTWSPDSSQIAYATPNHAAGQNTWVVRLRNIANGKERELYQGGGSFTFCLWAAQHPNLFCQEETSQQTTEVLSLSIDSGRVERLGSLPELRQFYFRTGDDRAIYMLKSSPDAYLIRWEVSTQQATTLDRSPGLHYALGVPFAVERWIARRDEGTIEIRPLSGGDWKRLISLNPAQMAFTEDGNWLLYHDEDAAGKQSLYRVATAGGQPERLGDFPIATRRGYLSISPDGRKIIAEALNTPEVWLLENFLPKQQAAK
jgi:Tol biopolymer transport system component